MTTDYKPLTNKQMFLAWISGKSVDGGLRAVEQAAIENYLAQHPVPQDAQAGKNAERYTWLRKALADRTKHGVSHWICSIQEGRPEELDAAIDAAIAAAKGKE